MREHFLYYDPKVIPQQISKALDKQESNHDKPSEKDNLHNDDRIL